MDLSTATRNLYEAAKGRFPEVPQPPEAPTLESCETWYSSMIALYESVAELTEAELKADDNMVDALFQATEAARQAKEQAEQERWAKFNLDPYGHLTWGVGSEDDFGCFDFDIQGEEVAVVTTLNSETGGFITNFAGRIVSNKQAVNEAIGQVDQVYEWCRWNDVVPDEEGWNYGGWHFVEAVKAAVEDTETANPFEAPPSKE